MKFSQPEFIIPSSYSGLGHDSIHANQLECLHHLDNLIDSFASRLAAVEEGLAKLGLEAGPSGLEASNPTSVANPQASSGRVYPEWLPNHSTTQQTYDRHCQTLGCQPTQTEIEAKLEPLVITRLWSKTDAANRLMCSPQEALPWLYFGKILGIFEFMEGKRVYKRIK